MQVRANQGESLDALCWRHLRATRGVVEQALEMNPGLADLGMVLPMGQVVELPDQVSLPARQPSVKLWD